MPANLEDSAVATGLDKVSFSFQSQRKAMLKNVQIINTMALISHASRIMFKILQARLQQQINQELPGVHARFRQGRGTRDQTANIHWIREKAREFKKKSTSASLTMLKPLTMQITTNCGVSLMRWNTRPHYLPPEKPVCRTRSNSQNWTWKNRLVPNWEKSPSRLYIEPSLFNLNAEYIIGGARLDESQTRIKIARRNINNLRYADDTTHQQKVKRN